MTDHGFSLTFPADTPEALVARELQRLPPGCVVLDQQAAGIHGFVRYTDRSAPVGSPYPVPDFRGQNTTHRLRLTEFTNCTAAAAYFVPPFRKHCSVLLPGVHVKPELVRGDVPKTPRFDMVLLRIDAPAAHRFVQGHLGTAGNAGRGGHGDRGREGRYGDGSGQDRDRGGGAPGYYPRPPPPPRPRHAAGGYSSAGSGGGGYGHRDGDDRYASGRQAANPFWNAHASGSDRERDRGDYDPAAPGMYPPQAGYVQHPPYYPPAQPYPPAAGYYMGHPSQAPPPPAFAQPAP